MRKFKLKEIRLKAVDIDQIDDRMLLLNLYVTQAGTLLLGLILFLIMRVNPLHQLLVKDWPRLWISGGVYALIVVLADLCISRFAPQEMTDDGGVNQRIFGKRAVWEIAYLSLLVAFCEEFLFRGAVQHAWGPYWTSILFAAIHVRYLRHWLMTGMVFGISYGMGMLYNYTGTLWAPVWAHFLIDFLMGCLIRYGSKEGDA